MADICHLCLHQRDSLSYHIQNQSIMNQRFLLAAFLILAFAAQLRAQNCTPISPFPDSAIAIPPSWSPARPLGGIQDTACIGQPFQFTLSIKCPSTIPALPGVQITSIAIPANNGVTNLPAGLSYVCNPPNCVFPRDSVRCIRIFGTPTNPADVGQKDLTLSLTINTPAGQFTNIPYPNALLDPGGHYYLHVKPAGSSGCQPSANQEVYSPILSMGSFPNPTTGLTQILLQSAESGWFDFRVTDLSGKLVHRRRVQIFSGENQISFDASNLPAGMYLYAFSNGSGAVRTEKLVISRR